MAETIRTEIEYCPFCGHRQFEIMSTHGSTMEARRCLKCGIGFLVGRLELSKEGERDGTEPRDT